ncbi:MAG: hypothetical protein C5B58_01335 [Acidobacteria bacterium]|nr:MAG: hypothetical protein C5B58_01335 [Acidobacteriota bacterium]
MYRGLTISRPAARATGGTYATYARRPAWLVEEAAALVTGFVPRSGLELDFRPDAGEERQPVKVRKTRAPEWADLLARSGSVGRVISAYARARHVRNWEFPEDEIFVEPAAFLEWCSESGVAVPSKLRSAVVVTGRPALSLVKEKRQLAKRRRQSVSATRKSSYRTRTQEVVQELFNADMRVWVFQLQSLVEHDLKVDRTVAASTFQRWLEEWRAERSKLGKALSGALGEPGRPSAEQRDAQERSMRAELPHCAAILWPEDQRTTKKQTNPANVARRRH